MYRDDVGHFNSTEHLGEVCTQRREGHLLQLPHSTNTMTRLTNSDKMSDAYSLLGSTAL